MGNNVSAIHQAAMDGNLSALRIAVQEQPQRLNDVEPAVGAHATVRGCRDPCHPSCNMQSLLLQNGWTALHIAAAKGFDVMTRELLARGAAVNFQGKASLHLRLLTPRKLHARSVTLAINTMHINALLSKRFCHACIVHAYL